jgi:hypothetical protein
MGSCIDINFNITVHIAGEQVFFTVTVPVTNNRGCSLTGVEVVSSRMDVFAAEQYRMGICIYV